jgi:copper chaperone CopZ
MSSTHITFSISGMHCGGCVKRVTTALGAIDAVDDVQVEVGSASFSVDGGADDEAVDEAAAAVKSVGFVVTERRQAAAT